MIKDPENNLKIFNNSETIKEVKLAANFFIETFKDQKNFRIEIVDSSKGFDFRIYLEANNWIEIFGERKKQPFSILVGKKSMTFFFRDNHKYFNDGNSELNIQNSKTTKKGGESTLRLHNIEETKNLIKYVFNKKLGLNLLSNHVSQKTVNILDLKRYDNYSRKDLHNLTIFDKDFVEGAGKWGLHGIVKVSKTRNDYVFFVTFGSKEAGFEFKEGVTKEGLLTWQSQPQQTLHHPRIKDFINHNEQVNKIHLILRTQPSDEYTYLGDLKYDWHNPDIEMPVQFKWQILEWEIKKGLFDEIGLQLEEVEGSNISIPVEPKLTTKNQLILSEELPEYKKRPRNNKGKKGPRKTDYEKQSKESKLIGNIGEELVLKWEQEKLNKLGINKDVIQISLDDDSCGYDIESYDKEGNKIYIEVKTTTGGLNAPFFISPNEVEVSKIKGDQFYIYRLYNLNKELPAAEYYTMQGAVENNYDLVPTEFKAYYNSEK